MSHPPIQTILFDFFGTLVRYQAETAMKKGYQDSYQYLLSCGHQVDYDKLNTTFNETYGELDQIAQQDYAEFSMNKPVEKTFEKLQLQATPEQIARFVEIYIDEWNRDVYYIEGVTDMIAALSKTYQLGIITNTHYPPLIHNHVKKMKLEPYLKAVLTSVEFGHRKPDKRFFEYAVAQMQSKPETTLVVGDSVVCDYEGATGAGLQGLLLGKGGLSKANCLGSIIDLVEWLMGGIRYE